MIEKPRLIILTGSAGSGLGTSIKAMEDLGFYCVDNLPFELVEITLDLLVNKVSKEKKGFAFAVHIYQENDVKKFKTVKDKLSLKVYLEIVFLTADQEILALRYNATRRKHPFWSFDEPQDLLTVIQHETLLLQPIKQAADFVIDTSAFSPHDLNRLFEEKYRYNTLERKLLVNIISFGFKHGHCRSLDTLFDVRFLPNPYFVPELKDKTGLNMNVRNFVMNNPVSQTFIKKLVDWHLWLLPLYHKEGKNYFRIGIGCTGGQHRSVSIVEELYARLKLEKLGNILIQIQHRDIDVKSNQLTN